MWIIILVLVVIVGIVIIAVQSGGDNQHNEEKRMVAEKPSDFEMGVADIAVQILLDNHSGCAYSGCCVYDNTSGKNDGVCHCQYLNKDVERHSPCEHFCDRDPQTKIGGCKYGKCIYAFFDSAESHGYDKNTCYCAYFKEYTRAQDSCPYFFGKMP